MKSYVLPEGYGQLGGTTYNGSPTSSNGYGSVYADTVGSSNGYGSVYAVDSLGSSGPDAAAYRLPGTSDVHVVSGDSDTFVLHGQLQTADSLDGWPAVSQLDNQLTEVGTQTRVYLYF